MLCEEDFDDANGDIGSESDEATPFIPPPPLAVNNNAPDVSEDYQAQLREDAYVSLRQDVEPSLSPGLII